MPCHHRLDAGYWDELTPPGRSPNALHRSEAALTEEGTDICRRPARVSAMPHLLFPTALPFAVLLAAINPAASWWDEGHVSLRLKQQISFPLVVVLNSVGCG